MAREADDQHVRDQCKVLTGLKLPGFNWKAKNMRMEFDIFLQTLEFMLSSMEIPKKKWYLYSLQQLGREEMEQWTTSIKASVSQDYPQAIITTFKKGYELEATYWTYRDLYLSSDKQGKAESVAALATRVEDLVSMCKWPDEQKEARCIDLFYHLLEVFDVRGFVQIEMMKEGGGNLMWEKLVEEAKRQERVGKEYAKFRRENDGSGTPTYGDPALAADAVSRGYNKPHQRSQTPSRSKGGKSQKQCDWCGKRNSCNGEKGTCRAWGRECGLCNGKNHYRAVCRKAAQIQAGGGAQPQFQKQGKGKPSGKNGKAKPKQAHSDVFKTVPSANWIVSRSEETASNSVTSEPSAPLSKAAKWGNLVLSGSKQSKTSLQSRNVFSYDAIHNMGDSSLDQCQTDTDPSGCLHILVDLQVRARATSRTHNIRVKADPGADANHMLIHHFRQIFPYLCDGNGNPKEGVLEQAESSFESYSRDNISVIGQTKIYARNKQTEKFMITRIFMIARERGPILLGNAACQWLGLIAVLIENKAPVVGRFMAAVTKEETDNHNHLEPLQQQRRGGNGPERQNQWHQLWNLWTSLWRPQKVSLSHLHLRGVNQTACKSKTRSFQEVRYKQNPVLK